MNENKSKINLILCIAGLHHGGAERVVADLCRNLDSDRYTVSVCWRTARGEIGEELKSAGFNIVGVPEIVPDVSPYLRFNVLKKLIRELRIDVIHTHDTGSLADAAQCRMLGSKAKHLHTFHFGNYPEMEKRHLFMEAVFSRFAHQLAAVGYEQNKQIQRSLHLSSSRLLTIYNGVEEAKPEGLSPWKFSLPNMPEDAVVIGSISTLTDQKGLFILLGAASILRDKGKNCVFVIAGGGPLREGLERKVCELGLERMIFFIGWVAHASEKVLPQLDIFCQSSLWEANSIVLLEAMAAGLPIVTTNVGESRHVIEQGVNGTIVEPDDPKALAEALSVLVDNVSRRASMGAQARLKFGQNYTLGSMVKRYEDEYARLQGNC